MILPSRATLIGYGVLLLTALSALGFGGCEHHNAAAARADSARMQQQRDQARANTDTAVDANKSLSVTIDAQNKALDEWAKIGATPDEVKQLVAAMKAAKERADGLLAEFNARRARDAALPACNALMRESISRACPSVADGLRLLTLGCHKDSHGRDPCADPEAAATGTH